MYKKFYFQQWKKDWSAKGDMKWKMRTWIKSENLKAKNFNEENEKVEKLIQNTTDTSDPELTCQFLNSNKWK